MVRTDSDRLQTPTQPVLARDRNSRLAGIILSQTRGAKARHRPCREFGTKGLPAEAILTRAVPRDGVAMKIGQILACLVRQSKKRVLTACSEAIGSDPQIVQEWPQPPSRMKGSKA
ncbi:hypothetical protein DW2_17365 [Thioclava atlantica]|uniref:Uncharacterized protein n=1 Tax=Thioclava atlantica TaxID=1317124 RepID=A0A085TSB2_9RHOB|nr:hypothetical protein DW2_17365 [Thioclava atlantica]